MSPNSDRAPLRFFLVAVILGGAVLLAFLMNTNKKAPQPDPPEVIVPLVEVMDLVSAGVRFGVFSQGTVEPAIETQITSEVNGTIINVPTNFAAGYSFGANETLVQIDPTLFRAARNEARATLRQRQIEFDGIKQLDARNYRSKIDLAAAEAALASAQAALVRAQNNLDKTRIRIPYDGIVRARQADVGQFVSPGIEIGTVFGSGRVEIRLPLSQRDIEFLDLPRAGPPDAATAVQVQISGRYRGVEATWVGQIVRTEAALDPNNRVTYAVAEVFDPYLQKPDATHQLPLPVGTFVSVRIPGRYIDNVLSVPRRALRGNGQLVFVDAENRLRVRTVPVLRTDSEWAYVSADAVAERRLVLTNLETPVSGRPVRIEMTKRSDLTPPTPQAAPTGPSHRPSMLQLDHDLSTRVDAAAHVLADGATS